MNRFGTTVAILALTLSVVGCTREGVYTPNVNVPAKATALSDAEVGKRIEKAAAERGWSCTNKSTNALSCSINVRSHQAVIDIYYNHHSYSIAYVSSKNLTYKDGTIHRSYNKWVKILQRDIDAALS